MAITTLLFDLGGIIYTGKREDFCRNLEVLLEVPKEEFTIIFKEHFDELLTGKIKLSQLRLKLSKSISKSKFEELAKKAWLSTFIVKKEMFALLKSLKSSYTLCCLSNASDLDVLMDSQTSVNSLFDYNFNSCELGFKKPETKIYQLALKSLACKAEECIFIDDREKYLDPAKEIGMFTILFENVNQLTKDLLNLGVTLKKN